MKVKRNNKKYKIYKIKFKLRKKIVKIYKK